MDGVELSRKTVDPLIVKEETPRDGEALAQQASDGKFSIVLFIIALGSVSFGMWSMVMRRRIITESLTDESDHTATVIESMEDVHKDVPEISQPNAPAPAEAPSTPAPIPQPNVAPSQPRPAAPPLLPGGLPEGWTMEQWNAYGWQYINSQK